MQKFSICIVDTKQKSNIEKVLASLEENKEYISEIIYTGSVQQDGIISLGIESTNEALHRNACIQKAKEEYIVWLTPYIELEDETLEEFADILVEEEIDIIYPNEVLILDEEETIKNFDDWNEKENELIQALTLEKYLPNWGIVTKKSLFEDKKFEEEYNDYCLYAFIYKNIKDISLKLSDLSFINHYISDTFIDTSYRSKLVRDIIKIYDLQEIFKNLDWHKEHIAQATAYTMIGDVLFEYTDYYNASRFYRNALMSFHNQNSLEKLIESYYQMGLFDEARQMATTQDLQKEKEKYYIEIINKTKELIEQIENAIEEGKAADVLLAAQDIISFYKGAPIYNILGVIYFIKKELESAYRFFYKAAIMNPLDKDILSNLAQIAKELNKEEEVIALYQHLTQE